MNRTTAIFGLFLIFVAMHELEGFTAGIGNAGLGKRDYVSKARRELQVVCRYIRSVAVHKRSGGIERQTPLQIREICAL